MNREGGRDVGRWTLTRRERRQVAPRDPLDISGRAVRPPDSWADEGSGEDPSESESRDRQSHNALISGFVASDHWRHVSSP
ncbi:hypothetical protein GCM10011579_071670 [Streptomyces albiflavescens]|uniref:Uncharacterized protein n=1 Tax=Streptomyces albiflavescens TaxID=1623582 RepID=A0A918D7W7_9ACTN|nr:hypothetical protein GCM10011579_071670 [Streptomyces albiflavescens]